MKTLFASSLALVAAIVLAPGAEKTTRKAPAPKPYSDTMWDMCTMPPKVGEKITTKTAPEKSTVGVRLTGRAIQMPRSVGPGRTAFVVTNRGKENQGFQISGQGIDRKFSLSPNETKTMEVDLKSGSYRVFNPASEPGSKMTTLNVK
jgi:hypothetical protein